MSETQKRILRVGASGLGATAIDLLLLLCLVELFAVQVALAAFLASAGAAISSFLLNKFWAFRDASPIVLPQVLGFGFVALGTAVGVAACVQLLSVQLGAPYLLAKAVGASLVFMCWSYPAQSRLVFARA